MPSASLQRATRQNYMPSAKLQRATCRHSMPSASLQHHVRITCLPQACSTPAFPPGIPSISCLPQATRQHFFFGHATGPTSAFHAPLNLQCIQHQHSIPPAFSHESFSSHVASNAITLPGHVLWPLHVFFFQGPLRCKAPSWFFFRSSCTFHHLVFPHASDQEGESGHLGIWSYRFLRDHIADGGSVVFHVRLNPLCVRTHVRSPNHKEIANP